MKNTFFIVVLLTSLIAGCKNDDDLELAPKPEPPVEQPFKAEHFLTDLRVTGSNAIKFDSLHNAYTVLLPDDFNANEAEVKLTMRSNIVLADSNSKPTKDSIITYKYQGTAPLRFELRDKTDKYWFAFTVYFNFEGTPDIKLLKNEIPIDFQGIKLPLTFDARVGSIPSAPEQMGPEVRIINRKTGSIAKSYITEGNQQTYIDPLDVQHLITGDPVAVEIQFPERNAVVFEGVKFLRGVPQIFTVPSYKYQHFRKDTLAVGGGYYIPGAKYTVKLSSDFEEPVTLAMRFNNASRLTVDKMPTTLSEGSYLLSFYENNTLIGKSTFHFSNFETKCLETIWQGNIGDNLVRNVTPPSFSKGESFYAKSLPLDLSNSSATPNFDINKLPRLRLKSTAKTVDLSPKMEVFNWSIAGVSYPVGKYQIPADLPAGKYAVSGIYFDRTESRPYWSLLEVK